MKKIFSLPIFVFLMTLFFSEWSTQQVYAKGKKKKTVQEDNPLIRMCKERESDEFIRTYSYEFEKKGRVDCLILEQDCRQSCYSALRLYPGMKEPESLFEGIKTEMDAQNIKASLRDFYDANDDGLDEIFYEVYWETTDGDKYKRLYLFQVRSGRLVPIWDYVLWMDTMQGGEAEYEYVFLNAKHDGAKDIKLTEKLSPEKKKMLEKMKTLRYGETQYFQYSKKEGKYIAKNK